MADEDLQEEPLGGREPDLLSAHGHPGAARSTTTAPSSTLGTASSGVVLDIRDRIGVLPHIYVEWTEGNPAVNLLRFLFFGVGEVAPVTREVLRLAEPDRSRRPHLHAG